ncbi:hypothetical protein [Soonwooa sp.]|uniref:hypothetical protein n=1 Tax=Soonwooa sp. TaxID=1938592 RepID=UPI0028A6DE27|nr:hypothetical protein [Soonwooa sp.]
MKEIIDLLNKHEEGLETINQRLDNIYSDMPTSIDVNKEQLEENVRNLKLEVEKLSGKLDHLIYLFENRV